MRRRDAGFTLLEMLVALVVFGLVMAGLAQTFRFGLTAFSSTTRRSIGPETLAAMDAALTRMIAQARSGSMLGSPDRLAFTTTLPAGAGLGGGLADVAISVTPDGTMLMRYRAHPPGIPLIAPRPPGIEILAHGVGTLKASYLTPQPGGAPAWSGLWPGGGLPLLVRIHIDLTNGQTWPDLIAAPVDPGD